MFSPRPPEVSSVRRRALRLALFRTRSSLPRLDQARQEAGKAWHPSVGGHRASARCGGLCPRAAARTARAVSSSRPTKCFGRRGEVLLPSLSDEGPDQDIRDLLHRQPGEGRSRCAVGVLVDSSGSIPPDQLNPVSSCLSRRERPYPMDRSSVYDRIWIIETCRGPDPRNGEIRCGKHSRDLVLWQTGELSSPQAAGHFPTPRKIVSVYRPMDPGSDVTAENVCTPH